MIKWVQRSELGWGVTGADAAGCAKGLVIHYNGPDTKLNSHKDCLRYWRDTRTFHMNDRGWADIGYSFGACKHGYVLVGRGYQRYQAAQGTTEGNRDWHSVTLMCGNTDEITDAQVNAVRELRKYLMDKGKGHLVRGHRDFFSTDCPGSRLYTLVKNGTFSKLPQEEEEVDTEVPQYVNVENTDPQQLRSNEWVSLFYDREWSDPNHHHWDEGSSNFVVGGDNGVFYTGHVDVVIEDVLPGSNLFFRSVEVDANQAVVEEGKVHTVSITDGTAEFRYPINGYVNANRKLRVQVDYDPDGDDIGGVLVKCQAVVFIWPKP